MTFGKPAPPVKPLPTPAPPVFTQPNPVPPDASKVYFCAFIEGVQTFGFYYPGGAPWGNTPSDTRTWDQFETDAGKKVWGLMFGQSNTLWAHTFNYNGDFDACQARGAVPILDVSTGQSGVDDTPLADITAGTYDAQITAWAVAARNWGHPFVFRLDAEMNGNWYNYGAQARLNPPLFVAMWRHIHDIFTRNGCTNAAWHWCPNIDPEQIQTPMELLYPGDAYVDWTGFTGYNAGDEIPPHVPDDWLFLRAYTRVASVAPTKPMMIGETGGVDLGFTGQKVAFIQFLDTQIRNSMPLMKAFCWFNWRVDSEGDPDWPIESSIETGSGGLAAFQTMVGSSFYKGRP